MKKITQLFICSFFLFIFNTSFSQTNATCKVLNKELKGEYTGQCKGGLAHGVGNFKFSDGKFIYKGQFKDGKMHGQGEIFSVEGSRMTSISKGEWNENVFLVDEIKDDYVVKSSFNMERYNLRRISDGNRVRLNFFRNGNRNSVVNDLNIYVSSGTRQTGTLSEVWDNVEFPLRIQLNYRTPNKLNTSSHTVRFEVVVNTPGEWDITLNN